MKKLFLFFLSSHFLFFISCKEKEIEPIVIITNTGATLIDSTKGFHRIHSIFIKGVATGTDLKFIEMTTQGNNRLNVAYVTDIGNSVLNRTLNRFAIDYTNNADLRANSVVPINWTTSKENEFLQFTPFSDQLTYGYVHLTHYNLQGDNPEGTGSQKLLGDHGRIAKSGQFVVNPFYFSDGIDAGFIYGYMKDKKWKTYWDNPGYTGSSPFNEGIIEPITGTNTGILISFHDDSVKVFTRNLIDTLKFSATRVSAVPIKKWTIAKTGKGTLIKNNEKDNDFSFAIYGSDNMANELIYRTFKYNYSTKSLTKVIDLGAKFLNEIYAFDIDPDGNFYFIKNDNSIYKTTSAGTVKISDNIILTGKPVSLKYLNGKLFLAVLNKNENFQLDIVVQN